MRVHLKTLGCRLNEAELETWGRDFRAQGHIVSEDAAKTDLVVVNTCAVTQEAARKSRQLVRRVHRDNPQAKLVISGCYASLSPEQAAAELGVDLVIPNTDKDQLVQIATRELSLPTMPAMAMEPGENALLRRGRQRAFVKVQDGCRYRCTYCIVTLARGAESSRPVDEVIAEINQLHQDGIQEVVLAGVHLGGYGSDINCDLRSLVNSVLVNTDIPRIRLGSLEPWDLPEDFWSLFDNPRLMPHLHLPIQSGSDSVLRRMARRCKTSEFRQLIDQARQQVADFNVTTDIIVGFPGETEDEWQDTLKFVEDIGFGHVHIFAYSAREGTKAARLPNPVDRDIKRQRSEALHELAARLKRDTLMQNTGRSFQVLVEGSPETSGQQKIWAGYTPNYLRVQFASDENLENTIVRVVADTVSKDAGQLQGSLQP